MIITFFKKNCRGTPFWHKIWAKQLNPFSPFFPFCIVWDLKPERKEDPINWVELKTTAELENDRDLVKYERKLLKIWIQSFLLGVPKIIMGFRSKSGILQRVEELETINIPNMVARRAGKNNQAPAWDGNTCINFTARFLECKPPVSLSSIIASSIKYPHFG